jgi:hypothetical protein
MNTRENVKSILALENLTLTEISKEMTKRTGKNYSMHNLSQKLSRKTIKFEEVILIMEILDYKIKFEKN